MTECVCVCICYDDLGDEAIVSTNPEPSINAEEHTDIKKVDPVKEEKPLKQGTEIKETSSYPTFLFAS